VANRFIDPFPQWFDASSEPYANGTLTFYLTGTTTLAAIYVNSTLSSTATNPHTLDAAGRTQTEIFPDPNITYRVILKNEAGTVIKDIDPYVDPSANSTASFQVYNSDPNGFVSGNSGTVGGEGASVIYDTTNELIWVCTTTGDETTAVWTAQGTIQSGAIQWTGVITPSALATDQDNYAPTDIGTASTIRQSASTDVAITGLTGGGAGRIIQWRNISTTAKQTLRSESSLSTAANRFSFQADQVILPKQSIWLWYDISDSRWHAVGPYQNAPIGVPGGRLTLTSATPVLTTDVTAATTVYYTPHIHNYIRLPDGVGGEFVAQFSELSQTLADTTKSPAAAAINSIYDMFVWNDAGTLRCTRGAPWATGGGSATARGTGAGSTELVRANGMWVNRYAITNGPTAGSGVYVGTIATDANGANGQLNMMLAPTAAAGGTANRLDVWNCYNRVFVAASNRDSTNTWTYTTSTYRAFNNSASNRITYVCGLAEDAITVTAVGTPGSVTSNTHRVAVGVDSSTVQAAGSIAAVYYISVLLNGTSLDAHYCGIPGLGQHYVTGLEYGGGTGTTTWYGDNGTTDQVQGVLFSTMM
jgi:hypothetical protein